MQRTILVFYYLFFVFRLFAQDSTEYQFIIAEAEYDKMLKYCYKDMKMLPRIIPPLQKLAEKEHAQAQYLVGNHYFYYYNADSTSFEIAINWYKKSANNGNVNAQQMLGDLYQFGQHVDTSYERAYFYYKQAAEQGNKIAQNNLGVFYENGLGVEKSPEKAFQYYLKAAEQKYLFGLNNMTRCYENGIGVSRSEEKVEEYRKKTDSAYALWMYRRGNYETSKELAFKLQDEGFADIESLLGDMYFEGKGVEMNHYKSADWYKKAAERGHPDAQYNLASFYLGGKYIQSSYDTIIYWLTKSAEQGHALAQYRLGVCYEYGENAPYGDKEDKGIDYEKAFYWYHKAAKQNHAAAESKVGYFYLEGYHVKKNLEDALKWLRRAKARGHDGLTQSYIERVREELNNPYSKEYPKPSSEPTSK